MTFSRTYRLLLIALFGWVLVHPAQAQSDATSSETPYFHEAAQQYLDGALQEALATVDEGLREDPDDPRLLALREKIQQQNQSSSNAPDDSDEQDASGDDAPSSEQDPSEQQDTESFSEEDASDPLQDAPSEDDATPDAPFPEDNAQEEETDAPSSADANAEHEADDEAELAISPEEAMRILQALENQEEQLLREVQKRPPRPRRIEKEW